MLVNKEASKNKLMRMGLENILSDAAFMQNRTQALEFANKELEDNKLADQSV